MFPLKDNIPTEHFPVVTVALIALNVLAYFFFQHGTLSFGDPSDQQYLQKHRRRSAAGAHAAEATA